jgi:hypothetical protein
VFEHVWDEREALAALAALLRPKGHLLWSAPFLERFHRAPIDVRRYTNESAAALLAAGGLCARAVRRAGDGLLATGYLLGMGTLDFTARELAAGGVGPARGAAGAHAEPALYFGVHALAQRPPCDGAPV